jgi:hypothetical protein
MTSFFRFTNKRTIYLDGKISLKHARCTHLSQVIKSQNKTIYTVVNVLNIYIIFTENNQHIKNYYICGVQLKLANTIFLLRVLHQ